MPHQKLLYPSIQMNMRAGKLPPPDEQGQRYLRIPINSLPPGIGEAP
jgi:hypothetical protein